MSLVRKTDSTIIMMPQNIVQVQCRYVPRLLRKSNTSMKPPAEFNLPDKVFTRDDAPLDATA